MEHSIYAPKHFIRRLHEPTQNWSHAIIAWTFLMRTGITLPLHIYALRQQARLNTIQPWMKMMKLQAQYDTTVAKRARDSLRRSRIRPFAGLFGSIAQIPIFVATSMSLRDMTEEIGMTTEGLLWFTDLTKQDPSLLTSLTIGFFNLSNLYLNQSLNRIRKSSGRFVLLSLAVASIPVSASMPMVVNLYWTTSSGFSFVQNLALSTRFMRRLLKIPL